MFSIVNYIIAHACPLWPIALALAKLKCLEFHTATVLVHRLAWPSLIQHGQASVTLQPDSGLFN